MKQILLMFFKIIIKLDNILIYFFNKSIITKFTEYVEQNNYTKVELKKKIFNWFTPNYICRYRVSTILQKEPETIEWIDNFKTEKETKIFWDIGSNIGIYSVYAAKTHKNIKVISFEPSTSNLRVLSRNIHINNLVNKISIFQIPLTNEDNKLLTMYDSKFIEGWAMNSFGKETNYNIKDKFLQNNYKIFGTSINYLIENNILELPDYIKIDVDGIEDLILSGSNKYLSSKKIQKISIEIDENFEKQKNNILKILEKHNFVFDKKHQSAIVKNNKETNKTYNYHFIKKF